MRRMLSTGLAAAALLLAGCSQGPGGGAPETTVAKQEVAAPPGAGGRVGSAIGVAAPQIAYVYRYGFDVPADAVFGLQDRHIALCDRLGAACRVIEMRRAAGDGGSGFGTLNLAVRAGLARGFGRAIVAAAAGAGGTQASSSIAAEDLSKQIVDTEARLRAKQALADRLLELLRTRSGPVADLVAAERAVAEVQEEIDAARSWLAEARGRVATSTFEISYDAGAGEGFVAPLREAVGEIATLLGWSLAMLVRAIAAVLPWALVAGAIGYAVRAWRRRRRAVAPDA